MELLQRGCKQTPHLSCDKPFYPWTKSSLTGIYACCLAINPKEVLQVKGSKSLSKAIGKTSVQLFQSLIQRCKVTLPLLNLD